ncbi:Hexose_transporter [Hexamita inflata]|uniref:Hexose_transporter n=1 Tax=Hexamita inflata TaxID=28002 RepID=A0ABP1ISW0_9EUKA
MKAIILAYIIGGLNRGAALSQLTTVMIFMYKSKAKYNFALTIDTICLLSIASIFGSIFGTMLQPKLVKKFGRYITLRIVAVCTLIINSLSIPMIHWGYLFVFKILSGTFTVMQVTLVPAIGAEVLAPKIRGVVGALTNMSLQLSMIICNIIQYFICLDTRLYPVSLVFPCTMSVLMIILTFMMKEEPQKKDVEAQSTQTQEAAVVNQAQDASKTKLESIFQKKYIKSFVVAITMGMAIGATGINPVLQYSTIIFKDTFNSKKSGTIGALITSSISLGASLIVMPFIRRFKRKQLFVSGLTLMLLCFAALILVLYLKLEKTLSNDLVLCITAVMILSFHMSSASLFYIIIGEVFPLKIKTTAISIAMATASISVIIQTYVFPHMKQQENYVFFLCWMFLVYLCVIFFVPETSNKTLKEIELEMIPKKYHEVSDVKEKVDEPSVVTVANADIVISPSVSAVDQ